MTERKARLIGAVHALKGALKLKDWEYRAMLEGYGVESSKDMEVEQLETLLNDMRMMRGESDGEREVWRRRLLAAVCAMCADTVTGWEDMPREGRLKYAKSVACRAAGVGPEGLNRIGLERLRSLTFAFQKRKRDMDRVMDAVMEAMGKRG